MEDPNAETLLGELLNKFVRLGSCYSPVIPTTIIEP
jgi:hypothetical protein